MSFSINSVVLIFKISKYYTHWTTLQACMYKMYHKFYAYRKQTSISNVLDSYRTHAANCRTSCIFLMIWQRYDNLRLRRLRLGITFRTATTLEHAMKSSCSKKYQLYLLWWSLLLMKHWSPRLLQTIPLPTPAWANCSIQGQWRLQNLLILICHTSYIWIASQFLHSMP